MLWVHVATGDKSCSQASLPCPAGCELDSLLLLEFRQTPALLAASRRGVAQLQDHMVPHSGRRRHWLPRAGPVLQGYSTRGREAEGAGGDTRRYQDAKETAQDTT